MAATDNGDAIDDDLGGARASQGDRGPRGWALRVLLHAITVHIWSARRFG
ncbi:hypothetical protein DB30_03201 [Enhygromyxa salina]|uniref:Uncharacterized protein n=1 Tax=Enhygromyxa salina TaxID=215803 RepID=A0A0C2D771_9BACT|nr:hypothetical protein DB30_03201 [Enhygromyxa salina]